MSTLGFINKYLEEMKVTNLNAKGTRHPSGMVIQQKVKWIAPGSGICKVNVDGGISRDGR